MADAYVFLNLDRDRIYHVSFYRGSRARRGRIRGGKGRRFNSIHVVLGRWRGAYAMAYPQSKSPLTPGPELYVWPPLGDVTPPISRIKGSPPFFSKTAVRESELIRQARGYVTNPKLFKSCVRSWSGSPLITAQMRLLDPRAVTIYLSELGLSRPRVLWGASGVVIRCNPLRDHEKPNSQALLCMA